jgi:flagellar hook-length control protein FliK
MQAMPVESSPKLPVGNTKVIETQSKVNAPADGTPQATASMIEQAQDVQTVEVSPKPNSQSVISANDAGKFEYARTTSEVTTDAMGNSPAPLQPATQEAAQPFVTPDKAGKFQSRQAAVESSLTEPANSKIHPAEKQQGANPGIETAAARTPQAWENLVESVAGTGSGMEAKIRSAEVIQQIVHHVEARIHNRSTVMHLQLNPKELGVIDVQMVSGPQGVSVTFSAEQPATGRLLETQLSQLHQSLTDAGVQISGLNIGQHGQPRQEGGFLNQNPQFAQAPQQDASLKEANIQKTRHPVRVTGQTGEVDYLI